MHFFTCGIAALLNSRDKKRVQLDAPFVPNPIITQILIRDGACHPVMKLGED